MSKRAPTKKKQQEAAAAGPEVAEGWESLTEDGGSLPPNPELEDPEPASASADAPEDLQRTEERLVRLQADFENFRRRATKERTETQQYGHQNLVKDLLATVDNLERALDHARQSEAGDSNSLLQGVELVQREFLAALTKHGVVRIDADGQPFDPAVHEAMAQVPDETVAPNTIIEELQAGYTLRGRLLRPSRVVVSKAPEGAAPPGDSEQTEAGEAD